MCAGRLLNGGDDAPMTRAQSLVIRLKPLIPAGTGLDVRDIADYYTSLFLVEQHAISHAVPKRKREFSTGRASARAAMSALGVAHQEVPVGPSREPIWPEGYIGSISHSAELCVAMARKQDQIWALGTDLTTTDPLDIELHDLICTAEERRDASLASSATADVHKLIFSAKEALYKALFPSVRRFIDFHEVSIQLDLGSGTWRPKFAATDLALGASIEGSFLVTDREIVATAWGR